MAVRTMLRALVSRGDRGPIAPVEGFDAEFYREAYPDLAGLKTDAALERHYLQHGAGEGRYPNRTAALAALSADGAELPDDFDPDEYLARNPDLGASLPTRWAATEHFLRFGLRERRSYGEFDAALYGDLYFPDGDLTPSQLADDYEAVGRREGRPRSAAALARSLGVPGHGGWLKAIRPREFAQLNWTWAGAARTLTEAIAAMLREGVDRLAPIAFDRPFDAAYWREINPALAAASDAAAYRDWLFRGLDTGQAGDAASRLAKLGLPLEAFPEAFDWRGYARRRRTAGEDRWTALEALVDDTPATAETPLSTGGDATGFLAALGMATAKRAPQRSAALLLRARTLGPLDATSERALADGLLALRRPAEAFEIYRELAGRGAADDQSIVSGARAALSMGDPEAALTYLEAARGQSAGQPALRRIAAESVDAWFADRSAPVRLLYAAGRRDEGDDANVAVAEAAAARLAALDPLGASAAPTPARRVVMLANTDLRQCTHYRVEQKVELLARAGREAEVFPAHEIDAFLAALPGATAAIFYRLAGLPQVLRAIDYARRLGVPTYYEVDDLIFGPQYPDAFESYGGSISRAAYDGLLWGVPLFRLAMSRCDYGIASTPALAEHMRPLVGSGEVFVLPNALDHRNDAFLQRPAKVRRDGDVVLFYGSGTRAHNADFLELAGPAIAEILAARPDVRLVIAGYLSLDARLEAFRERITAIPFIPDARGFWSVLAEADINLAVLAPGPVADAKSEIKWLEAAVLGIPSVVSATQRYREVVESGVDGLIAGDAGSWRDALTRLIDDPALRAAIGERARAKALADYAPAASVIRLNALLAPADARAAETRRAVPNGRPRVLLVNAFFTPQTIGGATRVVRDNLDAFLAAGAPFDFAVACTDHGATQPYGVRVEEYRGAPVWRAAARDGVNMDWNPRDPLMGELFAELLDSARPDLVHFHAAQRWTGAAVEACARAGIPYLVTVHDAWWLSDHQFLVDERGDLHAPCEPTPARPPAPATIGDALARRRYLGALLQGARRVIGVSQTFADMHRNCGVQRVIAIPNGTPDTSTPPRRPSPDGRVRLAHIGGMSAHKGFHLLQAALRAGRYERLTLTVVDHARYGRQPRREVWGATPVTIVGKTPPEGMPSFYARHDVLLAPSTWPESYGLVAREALAAGLWVVAGDRGAMGEDVRPGVNGLIVDVADPAGLAAALAEIDATPARWLATPPPTPLRSAWQQADALLALYAEVLAEPAPPPLTIPLDWAGETLPPGNTPMSLRALRRREARRRWGRSAEAPHRG